MKEMLEINMKSLKNTHRISTRVVLFEGAAQLSFIAQTMLFVPD